MFRTAVASAGTSDVNELDASLSLENNPAVVNAHYEKVELQLKKSHYLQGTLPDGESDDLGYPGFERDEANGWVFGNHPQQTPVEAQQFKDMLIAHKHCFAYSMNDLPGYSGSVGPLTLPLLTSGDIVRRPRRHSAVECGIIDEKCKELETPGFIVKCPKPWTHVQNIVVAAKKDLEGNWTDSRMCIDYRPINSETKMSHYPMQRVDDCLAKAAGKRFFSKLDARSGFSQIPIALEDQPKTAFWWKGVAWMYTRAPFGLTNIPAHFQEAMDTILSMEGLQEFAACYIDDILIYSDTAVDHLTHVSRVLLALLKNNLKAHPDKSIFVAPVMEFLGFQVNGVGITPMDAKVAAIRDLKSPTSVPHLRSLLGFLNYYRQFVDNFSARAAPLTELLKKDAPWEWTEAREAAYTDLKDALCTEGLALRHFNHLRLTVVNTDWSNHGIGAVLGQLNEDGQEYIVACISRSLNKHEANYSSYEGEMLAAVWAIKTFRPYLLGVKFDVITDHSPLQWLMSNLELTGKHARWALALQEYDFTIKHRAGVTHQNADVPSRYPQASNIDLTGARLDISHPRMAIVTVATHSQQTQSARWAVAMQTLRQFHDGHTAYNDAPQGIQDEDALRHAKCLHQVEHALGKATTLTRFRCQAPESTTRVSQHPDGGKVACTELCMNTVAATFFDHAQKGIVLYEPFGGLCAGLEMILRCGIPIARYLYSDIDPVAQSLAKVRMEALHIQYGTLFPFTAFRRSFALPQDINLVTSDHLLKQDAYDQRVQWMVVAGWECQDLSPAGKGKGLAGPRSSTFYPLVNLCATLQLLQPTLPPAFLFENTAMQTHKDPNISVRDFEVICSIIGQPVLLDAARFGAGAHRLRNFWTNLALPHHLSCCAEEIHRNPELFADMWLDRGRQSIKAVHDDFQPFYPCNKKDERRRAFPTLVAFPISRAFRDLNAGTVYDTITKTITQPNVTERETLMGYARGTTWTTTISDAERHMIVGRAMDATTLEFLLTMCQALFVHKWSPLTTSVTAIPADLYLHNTAAVSVYSSTRQLLHWWQVDRDTPVGGLGMAFCTLQGASSEIHQAQQLSGDLYPQSDVWGDPTFLDYIRNNRYPDDMSQDKRRHLRKRATSYSCFGDKVFHTLVDGSQREVPEPKDRLNIITANHEETGHFGVLRTTYRIGLKYWWKGRRADVERVLSHCSTCDRVKASFNAVHPSLHPLPIEGMFYRWGCDLCGPFDVTVRGHKYLLVCIEHFSKWVEVIPLRSKKPSEVRDAFIQAVLTRFGAPAEVLTDRGGEFEAEFAKMLMDSYIDHRTTSADHPQTDGLAERMIQTMKLGIKKLILSYGYPQDWDLKAPWVAMGYRTSVQASTGLSPYEMLFGLNPIVPPASRDKWGDDVDFLDHPDKALESFARRGELMKEHCLTAGGNLKIAQHRDTLRYAKIRGGGYTPKVRKFEVGQYVYVRRLKEVKGGLTPISKPSILRIKVVEKHGVLICEGKCAGTIKVNVAQCAPCHLPNLDPRLDPQRFRPDRHKECVVCEQTTAWEEMMLCDKCNKGWHTFCLNPSVSRNIEVFICPECTPGDRIGRSPPIPMLDGASTSATPTALRSILKTGRQPAGGTRVPAAPARVPTAPTRQSPRITPEEVLHRRCLHYNNQQVVQLNATPGEPSTLWGKIHYLGKQHLPEACQVTFTNGVVQNFTADKVSELICENDDDVFDNQNEPFQVNRRIAFPTVPIYDLSRLPSVWRVNSKESLGEALRKLMPYGDFRDTEVTKMSSSMPGSHTYNECIRPWGSRGPCRLIIDQLSRVVRLANILRWIDPCSSSGKIAHCLRAMRLNVTTNEPYVGVWRAEDIAADLQLDPTQPGTYQSWQAEGHLTGGFISQPLPRLLDIVLPLAALTEAQAVCYYVPASYVSSPTAARLSWMQQLKNDHRLLLIMGIPKRASIAESSGIWFCIFRNKAMRALHSRIEYFQEDNCVVFAE